jgi:hypothetical protein
VNRPEAAHAGYTQAGVKSNGVVPNVIPAQFSMIATESVLHLANALEPIDVTLLGIFTDARELQLSNAKSPIDFTLLGIVTEANELHP